MARWFRCRPICFRPFRSAGASIVLHHAPFPHSRSSNRRADFPHRLSDWLLSPAHEGSVSHRVVTPKTSLSSLASKVLSVTAESLMELIGKANLRTLGLFQKRARSQAPFLHRHYPASSVLRACPPPQTAQPAPHGVLVESHDLSPLGLPVFRRSPPPRMPTPLPRRNQPDAIAISSGGNGLPQMSDGSASATLLFEACSAFTHVPACMVARSPE